MWVCLMLFEDISIYLGLEVALPEIYGAEFIFEFLVLL